MTIRKIFSRRFFSAQPEVSSYYRLEIIKEEPDIDSRDPEHSEHSEHPSPHQLVHLNATSHGALHSGRGWFNQVLMLKCSDSMFNVQKIN